MEWSADIFDDDYLYFHESPLITSQSNRQADVIWKLLDLEPGLKVLDVGCGTGRIANRLANRGCIVTGVDLNPAFLAIASAQAGETGLDVAYIHQDMRHLARDLGPFDRVISWFTSFGYFDDEENTEVLRVIRSLTDPGGRVLIDIPHRDWLVRHFEGITAIEREGDLWIERHNLDLLAGRMRNERIVIRGDTMRRGHYSLRLYSFTELATILVEVGYRRTEGFGGDGGPLSIESPRLVAVGFA